MLSALLLSTAAVAQLKQCTDKTYPTKVTAISYKGPNVNPAGGNTLTSSTDRPSFKWGEEYTVMQKFDSTIEKTIPRDAQFYSSYTACVWGVCPTFRDVGRGCYAPSNLAFNGGCINRSGTRCTIDPNRGTIPVSSIPDPTANVGCSNGAIYIPKGNGKIMNLKIKPTPSGGIGLEPGNLFWISKLNNAETFVRFTDNVNFCVEGKVTFSY